MFLNIKRMFCIAAIFVKYCYTTDSWFYNSFIFDYIFHTALSCHLLKSSSYHKSCTQWTRAPSQYKDGLSTTSSAANDENLITRARLGRVAPLGRPRSVYKSNVECSFLNGMMAKWPWRSRSMTSISNNSRENTKMHIWCKFGDSSSNPLQVITQTSQISKNSMSKWPKWPWRWRSTNSIFNTSWEYSRMHVWCKFGDSSPNLWWVIARTSQIS